MRQSSAGAAFAIWAGSHSWLWLQATAVAKRPPAYSRALVAMTASARALRTARAFSPPGRAAPRRPLAVRRTVVRAARAAEARRPVVPARARQLQALRAMRRARAQPTAAVTRAAASAAHLHRARATASS